MPKSHLRIGYLGPEGTFTEEALLTQADLVQMDLLPFPSIDSVLNAVQNHDIDLGFVPIENSIEGTVAATIDALIFDHKLIIAREVIHDVHLYLLGVEGSTIESLTEVWSYPHALAQCRKFLAQHAPTVTVQASTSTAEAARHVGLQQNVQIGAIAPKVSGNIYDLKRLAENIEDHGDNQTRFYLVQADEVQPPTTHDKTAIACFQLADAPGSLFSILAEFSARNINLTKLESRPSKLGLGQYCFVIEFDGHIASHIVGDLFISLKRKLADIKFLGSFPNAKATNISSSDLAKSIDDDTALWLNEIRSRIKRV